MSIPTIQNVFHCKIEYRFPSTPKTVTLGAHTFGALHNFHENFQFKPLSIDIIHRACISSSRVKMRQNEKALILALISF